MINKKISLICGGLLAAVLFAVSGTEKAEEIPVQKPTQTENAGELNFELDLSVYNGLDKKNIGWGFVKKKGSAPDINNKTFELFDRTNTFCMDRTEEKVLYLTFDEGYENGYTAEILDVLKEKQIPAAFFITGHYLENQEELVTRMVNEGHIVGNHTKNHPNMAKASSETVVEELKSLNDAFFEKYNKNMIYFRPPEGEYSESMLSLVGDMGYKTILWSFAYRDWDAKLQKGAEYAFEQVTPYLHNGAIILLHAVSADNAAALGDIIDYAAGNGFEFKSLDNLLRE